MQVQPPSGRTQPGKKARKPPIPPGVPGAALPGNRVRLGLLRIRSAYHAGASQEVSASPSEKRGVAIEAEMDSGPGDPLSWANSVATRHLGSPEPG